MIDVRSKELLISEDDRKIAAVGDNNSGVRVFRIPRVQSDGVDLSALLFRVDIRYMDTDTHDIALLDKEVTDADILLTWTITHTVTAHKGATIINLRGNDSVGAVKWRSYRAAVYIEETTGGEATKQNLTELEQLEVNIDQKTRKLVLAESGRVENENRRSQAESERENNETKRQETLAALQEEKNQLEEWKEIAKSWAVGETGAREGEDTDNAKYYANQLGDGVSGFASYVQQFEEQKINEFNLWFNGIKEEFGENAASEILQRLLSLEEGKLGKDENAQSASKLQTARNISLSGDAEGSAEFDGSKAVSIPTVVKKVGNATVDFEDSETVSGITDFQSFLSKLKSGGKLGELIRNFKAGMKYVIHQGLLVNNCLSDRADLALAAAQGKALQEQITQLNGKLPWKDAGSFTGNSKQLKIPSSWWELNILVAMETKLYTFHVVRSHVSIGTSYTLRNGHYTEPSNYSLIELNMYTHGDMALTLSLREALLSGLDKKASTNVSAMYR